MGIIHRTIRGMVAMWLVLRADDGLGVQLCGGASEARDVGRHRSGREARV
jgi:hypothetical protein